MQRPQAADVRWKLRQAAARQAQRAQLRRCRRDRRQCSDGAAAQIQQSQICIPRNAQVLSLKSDFSVQQWKQDLSQQRKQDRSHAVCRHGNVQAGNSLYNPVTPANYQRVVESPQIVRMMQLLQHHNRRASQGEDDIGDAGEVVAGIGDADQLDHGAHRAPQPPGAVGQLAQPAAAQTEWASEHSDLEACKGSAQKTSCTAP